MGWAGPYGATFLTLALMPLVLIGIAECRRTASLIALAGLAALWATGESRLRAVQDDDTGPVLRLVQPNAEQTLKWEPEQAAVFYARLLAATAAPPDPALGPPAAVIWPETAVTFLPAYQPESRAEIAAATGGAPMIVGALYGERRDDGDRWGDDQDQGRAPPPLP